MTPEQPTPEYLAVDLPALQKKPVHYLAADEWFSHFMVASQRALYAEHQLERLRRQMTHEQPTPTELAVDLTILSKIEGTPTSRQVAAKRALYAEHAARELLAALRSEMFDFGENAVAVLARYEGVYGEGGR